MPPKPASAAAAATTAARLAKITPNCGIDTSTIAAAIATSNQVSGEPSMAGTVSELYAEARNLQRKITATALSCVPDRVAFPGDPRSGGETEGWSVVGTLRRQSMVASRWSQS